jgi:hypothetical protein
MMKSAILLLIAGVFGTTLTVSAQDINEITAKGKKAYLEVNVIQGDIPDAYEEAKEHLTGSEWNEWVIVDKPEDGDFTIRLIFQKLGFGLGGGDGARVRVVAEVTDQNGTVLWNSKRYQGNAHLTTGYNALRDAVRKIVRRALKDELRGKK